MSLLEQQVEQGGPGGPGRPLCTQIIKNMMCKTDQINNTANIDSLRLNQLYLHSEKSKHKSSQSIFTL